MASNDDGRGVWITFFWDIENYSYRWNNLGLQSSSFTVESPELTMWHLRFYPRELIEKGNIKYCLTGLCGNGSNDTKIEYDIAILEEDGSVLQIIDIDSIYMGKKDNWRTAPLVQLEDAWKIEREAFLSQDALRFRCRLWRTDGKVVTPLTVFARTALKVETRNFLWKIARFSCLGNANKHYEIMSASHLKLLIFKISVQEDKVILSIKSLFEKEIFVKFHSFITDARDSRTDCGKWEMRMKENEESVIYALPSTQKYLMNNRILYLKDDALTLYCECSWNDGNDIHRIERIDSGIPSPCITTQAINKPPIPNAIDEQFDKMADLKVDFESLYSKSILSDVKLCSATRTFEAHKNILSARSPVFRAMFTTDMKEKMQETVEVPDLEDDTVGRMLLYMYTNDLKGLEWERALKLYAAADKYEVVALKSKCSSFLRSNLRANNVCDVLILADMHADVDLKMAGQDYIHKHEQEVYYSDEWKALAENNSTLAVKTMLLKWNTLQ